MVSMANIYIKISCKFINVGTSYQLTPTLHIDFPIISSET